MGRPSQPECAEEQLLRFESNGHDAPLWVTGTGVDDIKVAHEVRRMNIARVQALCEDIDWGELDHAYGFATDVPGLFEDLAVGDAATRKRVLHALWGNVFHQGTRFGASPAALSIIVQMATDPACEVRGELLSLAVGLLLGYEEAFIASGYDWRQYQAAGGLLERLQEAFDAQLESFAEILRAEDAASRASAARCLAWVRGPAESAKAILSAHLGREANPDVRATILYALSLLGSDDDAVAALDDDDFFVRGVAGLAIVRLHNDDAPAPAKAAALAMTGGAEPPETFIPFVDGELETLSGCVLEAIEGANEDPDVIRALSMALRRVAPAQGLSLATVLLSAAFPAKLTEPPSMLQREALSAVAETDSAWLLANIVAALASRGLPTSREALAEFAGIKLQIDAERVRRLTAELISSRVPDKTDSARVLQPVVAKMHQAPDTSGETSNAPAEILRSELSSEPRGGPSPDRRVDWLSFEGEELRIAGGFEQIGTMTGCSTLIAIEGERATRLPWPLLRRGRTTAVVTDGRGGFVVGGEWAVTDGRPGGGLVRISASGEVDTRWLRTFAGVTCNGLVRHEGTVFALLKGERFGATPTLVAIDLDRAEVVWQPRIDKAVTALATDDRWLVIGGMFESVEGEVRLGLAAFDLDSRALLPFVPPALGRAPAAIAITRARVYVGVTTNAPRSGETAALLAFERSSGAVAWRPDIGPFRAEVHTLAIRDGQLVVGGQFTLVEGALRNGLCAFSLDEHRLNEWAPAPPIEPAPHPNAVLAWGAVVRIVRAVGSDWFVAGTFTEMGGAPASGMAWLDGSGRAKPLDVCINGRVADLAFDGARSVVVGTFSMVNEPRFPGAAKLAGGRIGCWQPPVQRMTTGACDALGMCAVEVAATYPHAARIVYRGTDGEWEATSNASVHQVLLDGDRVWLAGHFTRVGREARHYLACLDRKTGAILPFRADLDKSALCLARVGAVLLVGGKFGRVRGVRTASLVAIDVGEGSLRSLDLQTNGSVRRLVVGPRHVLALGDFSSEHGARTSSALLLEKESLAPSVLPLVARAPHGAPWVNAAAFNGDRVVIAGDFTHVNGVERDKLAEIDLAGRVTDWRPSMMFTGQSPFIEAIAVHDGVLALGGGFVVASVDPPVTHLALFGPRTAAT